MTSVYDSNSFINRFSYSFSHFETRLNSIFIKIIILVLIFFELLLINSTETFWSNGGLMIGLNGSFNKTTSLYGGDGIFEFTQSICLLNLNQNVIWIAIRIPFTDSYQCKSLRYFSAIWKTLYGMIPYFLPISILWILTAIITFIEFITLFKIKSKILSFIAGILHIFSSILIVTCVILFCISLYLLFIKYIQDPPPIYINICFLILHIMVIIKIISFPTILVIKTYKFRYNEYENIQ